MVGGDKVGCEDAARVEPDLEAAGMRSRRPGVLLASSMYDVVMLLSENVERSLAVLDA